MAAIDDRSLSPIAFPATVYNLEKCTSKTWTVSNVVTPPHSSNFPFSGRTVGVCPVCESACLGGHGTCLAFSGAGTYRGPINREFLWSHQTLMSGARHTLCAHSPPTLYFSCLCLCSSLVFLCLPFMSVFVPYHSGTPRSACHAAPSPHGNVLFGQAHLLAYLCWHLFMFTTTNWEQRADVRRSCGRKEKGEWVHRHRAIIKWWHSKVLTNIRSLVIGKGKLP